MRLQGMSLARALMERMPLAAACIRSFSLLLLPFDFTKLTLC